MATTKKQPEKNAVVKKQAAKKVTAKKASEKKAPAKPKGCVDCKKITKGKPLANLSFTFYEKGIKVSGDCGLNHLVEIRHHIEEMIKESLKEKVISVLSAKKSPAKKK